MAVVFCAALVPLPLKVGVAAPAGALVTAQVYVSDAGPASVPQDVQIGRGAGDGTGIAAWRHGPHWRLARGRDVSMRATAGGAAVQTRVVGVVDGIGDGERIEVDGGPGNDVVMPPPFQLMET